MWIAFALLAAATIFVGVVAWYALDQAVVRLERLHSRTLSQVARSLSLSKHSADLSSSAPFLLNLRSPYLIQSEGHLLLASLEPVLAEWPGQNQAKAEVYAYEEEIAAAVRQMKKAIVDLVDASVDLGIESDAALVINAKLTGFKTQYYAHSINPELNGASRGIWLSLLTMTNELIGAGHSENLLGVGEHRRRFQQISGEFSNLNAGDLHHLWRDKLLGLSKGDRGLFEIRRRELSRNLESQNALFRIRFNADTISDLAALFASDAEAYLLRERADTATSIGFAKIVIMLAGVGSVLLALASSVFVSGYVIGNIRAISEAMSRLAQGDRGTRLGRKSTTNDEIGKLLRSFRIFRANALRLDRSNRQLHQKNALFEEIFENISDGVAITDEQGLVTTTNPHFDSVLKPERIRALNKTPIVELFQQSEFAGSATSLELDARFSGFAELVGICGRVLEVRCSRLPDGGGIWLFSDATERRKMDERLQRIRHIESLGKVAGEVAHDFGNVLSAVVANLHLLEAEKQTKKGKIQLQRISNAIEMGTSLTHRLLAFARKQALVPEIVELNELVEGLADFISIGLEKNVQLETVLSADRINVLADPGQLESAILNLCLNSNQAIDDKGVITITVSDYDDAKASIEVRDNGHGMEEAVRTRSLEPFYTARENGEGTGLGLSMVYGFIKQTGGDIEICSEVDEGTTVTLWLPVCENGTRSSNRIHQLKQTVLLVEDDKKTMAQASKYLGQLGFTVTEASTYIDADTILKSDSSFDALVTDLHLGTDGTGWDLADKFLADSSDTIAIVMSGKMPERQPEFGDAKSRLVCIAKPLTAGVFGRVLGL
ncbi:MAG: HAMP domain-containing protein [Cohaesibacteraceae bacterium]|nr:HAMP domain-containing protein [Cohaesibacteraceae bacterium]